MLVNFPAPTVLHGALSMPNGLTGKPQVKEGTLVATTVQPTLCLGVTLGAAFLQNSFGIVPSNSHC